MENLEDIEHAMITYLKQFQQYENQRVSLAKFNDGWAFATILKSVEHFKLSYADLDQNTEKWTFKLGNLKKVLAKVEEYFEDHLHKIIKTKDIDLVEIAKNSNQEEIIKFFEVVVATLTSSPNKEDHIGLIMSLDERSQSAFMQIIQNVLQHRIQQKSEKQANYILIIDQLQTENNFLREEVEQILHENNETEKQLTELRLKLTEYEQAFQKIKGEEIQTKIGENSTNNEQLRHTIENLKEKLLHNTREHEIQISRYKEELLLIEHKLIKYDELQQAVEIYKQKYNEALESGNRMKVWEKEKIKLNRMIEEKDVTVKKMQEKIDEANELNFTLQERQLYMKMEIEKRDIRFKQLEKEVKKRIGTPSTQPSSFSLSNQNIVTLSAEISQIEREELEELRTEIEKAKKKNREGEKEINRLKRSLEKLSTLENDKKKLQRLILDINNQKKQQLQILISTTHQLYIENLSLKEKFKVS